MCDHREVIVTLTVGAQCTRSHVVTLLVLNSSCLQELLYTGQIHKIYLKERNSTKGEWTNFKGEK